MREIAHIWYCRSCCRGGEPTASDSVTGFELPSAPDVVCADCGKAPSLEEQRFALLAQIRDALGSLNRVGQESVLRRKAYSLSEAAALLGISLTKVKDEIRAGEMTVVHAGRRRRILDAEISRYLLRSRS